MKTIHPKLPAVAAGKAPNKEHVYDVIAIFKSLKADAIAALRKGGFKLSKVRGKSSLIFDKFDDSVRDSAKKVLAAAGFKVKNAKDRHGNTNLIVDRVFNDFMKLDLQVCSITSKGTLYVMPKRLSGLEVKMLKALLASGVYTPRASARPAAKAANSADEDQGTEAHDLVNGTITNLHTNEDMEFVDVPLIEAIGALNAIGGTEFGTDWEYAGDTVPTDDDDAMLTVGTEEFSGVHAVQDMIDWAAENRSVTAESTMEISEQPSMPFKPTVAPQVSQTVTASDWTDFLKGKMGKGKSLKELSAEFKKQKAGGDKGEEEDEAEATAGTLDTALSRHPDYLKAIKSLQDDDIEPQSPEGIERLRATLLNYSFRKKDPDEFLDFLRKIKPSSREVAPFIYSLNANIKDAQGAAARGKSSGTELTTLTQTLSELKKVQTQDHSFAAEASVSPALAAAWENYINSIGTPFRTEAAGAKGTLEEVAKAFKLPIVGETVNLLFKTNTEAQAALVQTCETIANKTSFTTRPRANLKNAQTVRMDNDEIGESVKLHVKKNFILITMAADVSDATAATSVQDTSDDNLDQAYARLRPAITNVISTSLAAMGLKSLGWALRLNGTVYGDVSELDSRKTANRIALQAIAREVMPKLANLLQGEPRFHLEDSSFIGFGGEIPVITNGSAYVIPM